MAPRTRLAGAAVLGILAACGGDDGADPGPANSVSGTVTAAAASRMDGDTGDPGAPFQPNDTFAAAQPLPSAVTVGGWASASLDGNDWYLATLAASQQVTLALADPVVDGIPDLDLELYTVSDLVNPVCESLSVEPVEVCEVPFDGEYFVRVIASAGTTNYVLNLGQRLPAAGPVGALRLGAEFVPGEVIVRFREGVHVPAAAGTLEGRAASVGLEPLAGGPRREVLLGLGSQASRDRAFAALGIERTPLDAIAAAVDPVRAAKRDTIRVVKALRRRLDVAGADPNYVHRPSLVPNDTYYPLQWHYPAMKLPQAWNLTTGAPEPPGEPPIVAVVDTGVVLSHPDLAPQLVPGFDFISDPIRARDGDGIDPDPDDPGDATTIGSSSWHGTHVAGTVAARTNNAEPPFNGGVAGVSWEAKVMPIRVLGVGGGTSFDILQGIRWASQLSNDAPANQQAARRADVINLSLGCLGCFSATTQAVFDEVRAAGVVVVAAAGNENTSQPEYPASYAGVLSVSAVDMALARAPYSNFGPTVDVAAPGGNLIADRDANGYGDGVLSTFVDDAGGTRRPAYAFLQGTSMASPHVAGVIALAKALCPTLGPADVDALLAGGMLTVDLGPPGRDDVYGHGFLDALAAVQNCGAPIPTTLGVNPGRLDFGSAAISLPLTASRVGSGSLSVTGVSGDAAWLTVAPTASVDPDGFGQYTVSVDRSGLATGVYSATITFTTSAAPIVAIPVTLQVGGAGGGSDDVGHLYVLLVNEALDTVAQKEANASGGHYPFSFPSATAGSYYVVAGTDSDDDGFICDGGEACGAYPTVGLPTLVDVTGSRGGIDFTAGFEVNLAGAATAPGRSARGFRLLAPARRVEAGR